MQVAYYIICGIFFWIAGLVFAYPLARRDSFWKRIVVSGIGVTWIVLFGSMFLIGHVQGDLLRPAVMIAYYIGMFLFLVWCWDIAWTTAAYYSIWVVILWKVVLEIWYVAIRGIAWNTLLLLIGFFALAYLVCGFTIARFMPITKKPKVGPRQLASAILVFVIFEVLSVSHEMKEMSIVSAEWRVMFLTQQLCVLILYLQNELFKKSAMREELQMLNLLREKEHEQFELRKENIEIINQKSHDLKHQIRALRYASKEEFEQFLDEIEESVQIYESIVKTGNEVLDTILTDKSLYCRKRGIQVSCVADGSQMDFINTVDLYTILGNALDNAIEAVEKFRDKEKRQIDVLIYRERNFLVINIINPFKDTLKYDEELPVSTKADHDYHGFGLKSMKYVVHKYDGFLNIAEEDGCFSLKMLFPIPD